MKKALEQAEQGRFLAPPNPWVGCVVVKGNSIIGQGYTQEPGNSHAEVMALNEAGINATGADLYVTLEPCSHWGRTPPCANRVIQAGIKKVYVSIVDPDSHVQGKGIAILSNAGIEVHVGVCAKEVEEQLKSYLYHRRTGLPYVVLKSAVSLDGRVAAQDHTSQWISDALAREDVHHLRAQSQAILVGAGTAIVDKPQLTVRSIKFHPKNQPVRVVCDAKGRLPAEGPLFDMSLAPTWIFTTEKCPKEIQDAWKEKGAEVFVVGSDEQGVNLKEVLQQLGARGILQVLVEGGSCLHSIFIKEKLFQEMVLYYGNCLLGKDGLPLFSHLTVPTISEAPRLQLLDCTPIGNTIKARYAFS